jgi:hypothetical protein
MQLAVHADWMHDSSVLKRFWHVAESQTFSQEQMSLPGPTPQLQVLHAFA